MYHPFCTLPCLHIALLAQSGNILAAWPRCPSLPHAVFSDGYSRSGAVYTCDSQVARWGTSRLLEYQCCEVKSSSSSLRHRQQTIARCMWAMKHPSHVLLLNDAFPWHTCFLACSLSKTSQVLVSLHLTEARCYDYLSNSNFVQFVVSLLWLSLATTNWCTGLYRELVQQGWPQCTKLFLVIWVQQVLRDHQTFLFVVRCLGAATAIRTFPPQWIVSQVCCGHSSAGLSFPTQCFQCDGLVLRWISDTLLPTDCFHFAADLCIQLGVIIESIYR